MEFRHFSGISVERMLLRQVLAEIDQPIGLTRICSVPYPVPDISSLCGGPSFLENLIEPRNIHSKSMDQLLELNTRK